jgi:hypothetical protein
MNYRVIGFIVLLVFGVLSEAVRAGDYSALVVDPETERVLYERYADELRHPASVTKIMTLYLVFEALDRGELTLNTPLKVSRNAVLKPPSRLGMTPGDSLAVEDAILALVTRSANDVAAVIAENLGGSEADFADMMTAKARMLGMRDTVFRNASGLPDPQQVTTAWDMYKLGKALIKDFPRYYPYFSTPRFFYRGQSFDNHNHLMETYYGMDGIKTGFINSSGFNLVASAKRGGRRIIGVVFGGPSAVRRDDHMREILDDGFSQLSGNPPGFIEADFDKPLTAESGSRFSRRFEEDPPQVTFGSVKRFKSSHGLPERSSEPSSSRSARPLSGASSSSRSSLNHSRLAPGPSPVRKPAEAARAATSKSHGSTVILSNQGHAAPAKSRADGARVSSVATSRSPTPATAVCKGGKDKNGKCQNKPGHP